MSVLIIDETKIQELKNFAEANFIDRDEVDKIMAGTRPCAGDRAGHSINLDVGYRVVYSIEEVPVVNGHERVWVRHMSMSASRLDRAPNLVGVAQIAELLGFPPIRECQISLENSTYDVIAPVRPATSPIVERDTVDEIILHSPLDMHVHFRQGEMLRNVVPLTASTFAGALVMPNTDPPITTVDQVEKYMEEIADVSSIRDSFLPYVTLYFQTSYTKDFLEQVRSSILSIKFYPKNLTTNSQHGCDPADPAVYKVLEYMEELGIPLNIHPEAEGYYHDREALFHKYVHDWTRRFPNLTIVLEHLSDGESVRLLDIPNVYGTVTPQHLLTQGNDWFGPPFNPYLYCMPCVKRPEDREILVMAAVLRHASKLMAGTDSAPHTEDRKVQCGCAGVFSAPIALQLYAQVFSSMIHDSSLEKRLQAFVSDNARRIYKIEPPATEVRLVRQPFVIPDKYHDLIPMWAGKTIDWSVQK